MGLDDYPVAFAMRDRMRAVALEVIDEERPKPRIGQVVAVNTETKIASVQFPEGGDPAPVSIGSITPLVGVYVRVDGLRGDRYIDEVFGQSVGGQALLQIVTLDATTASIQLDVPLGFREVLVRGHLRTDAAAAHDGVEIAVNSDTTVTDYYKQNLLVNGTTVSGSESLGVLNARTVQNVCTGATAPANSFGDIEVRIGDYLSSFYKNLRCTGSALGGITTGLIRLVRTEMWWTMTDPVASLAFEPSTGTVFAVGSELRLYGIS